MGFVPDRTRVKLHLGVFRSKAFALSDDQTLVFEELWGCVDRSAFWSVNIDQNLAWLVGCGYSLAIGPFT
jgi:hypothetical protein